ncbi:MAG: hypothetical protein V1706_01965 [Pseudomonadota bacterium]
MKRIVIRIVWFGFLVSLLSTPVWADCIYDGIYYPTGTKIGDLTCQPDGTWK